MPKKNRALFLSRVKGMRGRAMTHLRILSSKTASPPLFVFSCPHSCEDWQGRGARSAKFVKFHRKKAAVRRYLPFYPVVYLLCPYPPFLPCRRRPWSCRRVPFCPMTSFPVSFPCPYPRWRPSECADPKFPRHLDSIITTVDRCDLHFFLVLPRPTRRRPQALRGSASGFHSSAKLQNRAVLQVS